MPLTLGIDCSLRWLSLGLADGERALAETNLDVGRGQAERLPGEAERFLAANRAALRDVGLIAVTVGPGYYTGIRVGVAYATALAEALGLKVAPVSTLRALAHDLLSAGWTAAPALRANSRTLYGALYRGRAEIFAGCFEPPRFAELLRENLAPSERAALVGADALPWPELAALGCLRLTRPPSIGLGVALAAAETAPQEPSEVGAVYMREPD